MASLLVDLFAHKNWLVAEVDANMSELFASVGCLWITPPRDLAPISTRADETPESLLPYQV
jgi:hypothetical protein